MTTTTPDMVSLDEADIHSLRHHATVTMGLDCSKSMNGQGLRAKIKQADAGIENIPVFIPTGEGTPRADTAATPAASGPQQHATANGKPIPRSATPLTNLDEIDDPMHHKHDPRVGIVLFKTDDKRRSRDVQVGVNGVGFVMNREVEVFVPYRVYLALRDAVETAYVDGDDLNPVTGEPFKVATQIESYPFRVTHMPGQEEIDAWTAMTSRTFQKAA